MEMEKQDSKWSHFNKSENRKGSKRFSQFSNMVDKCLIKTKSNDEQADEEIESSPKSNSGDYEDNQDSMTKVTGE